MWLNTTWVLIPCPRSRLEELLTCIEGLEVPSERLVVVTTEPDSIFLSDLPHGATLILDDRPGMWISRWWNMGLRHIANVNYVIAEGLADVGRRDYEVLVIGSDVTGTQTGVQQLQSALRTHHLSMVGPDWHRGVAYGDVQVRRGDDVRTLWNRIPGACFMLAGEDGRRLDENFRWWYSDDDLERQAQLLHGVGLVGGVELEHLQDHELSAEQTRHAIEDRARYVSKWGVEPW